MANRREPLDGLDQTRKNAQANLVRVSKLQSGRARDWSYFFFFRILTRAEMEETRKRLTQAALDPEAWGNLRLDLTQPGLMSAGLVAQRLAERAAAGRTAPSTTAPDHPAQEFLHWLDTLANNRKPELLAEAAGLDPRLHAAFSGVGSTPSSSEATDVAPAPALLDALREAPGSLFRASRLDVGILSDALAAFLAACPGSLSEFLELLSGDLDSPGSLAAGPLPMAVLHELLRQAAPAFASSETKGPSAQAASDAPMIREEDGEKPRPHEGSEPPDRMPINLAFTYGGLSAMKIDEGVLASFPEAFKEGMAARARRLHDTGPSAPENWDGELGLDSVHGYFTGGSESASPMAEAYWVALRADIAAFNDRAGERGEVLRMWIGLLFRFLGLEIVHIELGQEPYRVTGRDRERPPHRIEHFGFRDGLSQPFVDMGLGDTLPGGGTPGRSGSWTPVAPGEIFLDQPDEDGEPHRFPIAETLRVGSTYLVFRKLEQDVLGFRKFLESQSPGDKPGQELLAAQMVGRWKNGTPIVRSPNEEWKVFDEAQLNDFRYRDPDGSGQQCPLGAHIRRANPRDIGKPGEVRHHRILRRGISYGGPLLPEGSSESDKRGLLFIAANARIDLQFEVIQASWMNAGEFLGQAGLDRCPLTGANDGETSAFLRGGGAPVTALPRFVTTRGGDYFFAPGVSVVRAMTNPEQHFKVPYSKLTRFGFSMAEAATPSLFDKERLQNFAMRLLKGAPPIRAQLPPQPDGSSETVVFVGRYSDVCTVLRSVVQPSGDGVNFSSRPYHQAGRRLTGGETMMVGADLAGPTRSDRERLKPVLDLAWATLAAGLAKSSGGQKYESAEAALRDVARNELGAALGRAAGGRHIDLVSDLAVRAAYGVIVRIYGVRGPSKLAGMASTPSSSPRHIGDLPRDWVAALQGERNDNPGLTTMQAWAAILAADLIGNVQNQQMLQVAARRAASEMTRHFEHLLAQALARDVAAPSTLIEAFVLNESLPAIRALYPRDSATPGAPWTHQYYEDVAVILLEIVSTTLIAVPHAFASVMAAILKYRVDLGPLLLQLREGGVARLIYEAERLEPSLGLRMRQCEIGTDLAREPGAAPARLEKGDFIVAMVSAANKDCRVFAEPHRFSLTPYGPTDGPQRKLEDYLMFGVNGSEKACWGRDRVAMPLLEECVVASGRLRGLRKVAGPGGEPKKLAGLTIGLTARFTAIAAAGSPKPEQATTPPPRSSNRSPAAQRDPLLSEDRLAP